VRESGIVVGGLDSEGFKVCEEGDGGEALAGNAVDEVFEGMSFENAGFGCGVIL